MPLKTKKLLVQFEYDPGTTRWLCGTGDLRPFVKRLLENVATSFTAGTIPAVTITEEETPETIHHANNTSPN